MPKLYYLLIYHLILTLSQKITLSNTHLRTIIFLNRTDVVPLELHLPTSHCCHDPFDCALPILGTPPANSFLMLASLSSKLAVTTTTFAAFVGSTLALLTSLATSKSSTSLSSSADGMTLTKFSRTNL